MPNIIGRQIEVGVGVEETRGTVQSAPEKWMKKITANIVERAEKIVDQSTRGRLEDAENARVVRKWVEGDLEGNVHADAIGYLFLNIYGAVTSTVVAGSAVPAYDHVFSLAQNLQHPSLTFVVKDGGVQQRGFNGGMLSALTLDASVNDFLKFKASIMAREGATNADSVTYDTEYDFIGRDIVVKVADTEGGLAGATATKVKSLSVNWKTGLIPNHVLGSYSPDDIYNGQFEIDGQFSLDYIDNTFKDLFLADTNKYMSITITGAASIDEDDNNPTITLILNKVQVMDWNREGGAADLVTSPISFKAFYNPTDAEMSTLTIRNLTAEYDEPVSA
ncbi:MAG: phage tail tube protein [Candidatus Omnitrophota bacterium]|nr:phage tail tube protein [Candidatus Omnitrophota bacterium]